MIVTSRYTLTPTKILQKYDPSSENKPWKYILLRKVWMILCRVSADEENYFRESCTLKQSLM